MKRKLKFVNGHIVVKNPLAWEMPDMKVTLKSGKTTYRFSGKYDGKHTIHAKTLRLMEKDDNDDEKSGDI